jgi:spermidine/putrescine transport system permease protein
MSNAFRFWGLVPAWAVLLVMLIVPIAVVAGVSVAERGAYGGFTWAFDLTSYRQILITEGWTDELEFDPKYLLIIGRTLLLAGVTTLICLQQAQPEA